MQSDVLIIGSGAAGLAAALLLAGSGKVTRKVTVLSKVDAKSGATPWAQGGIAAVSHEHDTPEDHVSDTLTAGAGLCNKSVVRHTVTRGSWAIDQLIDWGVQFDLRDKRRHVGEGGEYHLTREGGHSARRVFHVADSTGAAIASTLMQRALEHPNIQVLENRVAIDLILDKRGNGKRACIGVYVLNRTRDAVEALRAPAVILASGGASKVYLYTSNPDTATGDGIAMAWRAGCSVANMEFNQFHPTCLYHPHAKSFLISEAMRGEGGVLRLPSGEPFMSRFHELADLAPRDVVARAMDHEMKRLGIDCVYLDVTHFSPALIEERFPNIAARCAAFGIDIARDPIPVVPAAHYSCGGVRTNLHGQTDLLGLYAIGETASTGLHGANRLASNSLLECLVFARGAAEHILASTPADANLKQVPAWDESQVIDADEQIVVSHNWDELRRFMWDYVGIVRTTPRLTRAAHRIELLRREIHEFYSNYRVDADLIELRNLVEVADLIVRSALRRRESRGLHYTLSYPKTLADAEDTVLVPQA